MIIKQPVVFVLGAGASAHLGYPTGIELKKAICSINSNDIFQISDFSAHEIDRFKSFFAGCPEVSIDRFLKNNPEYGDLGKILIAASLFPFEQEDKIVNMQTKYDWYSYFWNIIDCSYENIDKNNIEFITFNYDRSLEYFLYTALFKSYFAKKSREDVAVKINNIKMTHVYGKLAPLPWQGESKLSRPYKPNFEGRDLKLAANNILLIGEERKGETFAERKKKIQSTISKAKYVYFLGFGFDEDNLDILGDDYSNAFHVWGTSQGLGARKQSEVLGKLGKKQLLKQAKRDTLNGSIIDWRNTSLELYDSSIMDFLRDHPIMSE